MNQLPVAPRKKIKFVSCHRIPERSFFYKGEPYLCYRCLGIYVGFLASGLITIIGHWYKPLDTRLWLVPIFGSNIMWVLFVAIVLMIPTNVDGLIQGMTSYTSTNPRRSITGLMAGVGQQYFFVWFGLALRLLTRQFF